MPRPPSTSRALRDAEPACQPPPAPEALLLVAHGTREAAGVAEAEALAAAVATACPGRLVRLAYLELVEPQIGPTLAELASADVRSVAVVPLLLFAAGHAKRDLPRIMAAARARHPGLHLSLATPFGRDGRLLAVSRQRFCEALAGGHPQQAPPPTGLEQPLGAAGGPGALTETLLVMVGRGSTDPQANAEMAAYARLHCEQLEVGWHEVCFTALAEPGLERALELAACLPFRQVVVQPHLLFRGLLAERIAAATREAARRHPDRRWIVTDHLGVHPLVVALAADLSRSQRAVRPIMTASPSRVGGDVDAQGRPGRPTAQSG